MTYIFCIDDKCGMSFLGKRQSRDRILNAYLTEVMKEAPLYVTPYSAPLFREYPALCIGETPTGYGYAFVEDGPYDLSIAEEVVLCRWNRHYPGDRFFDEATLKKVFQKIDTTELVGSSHEKITIETWRRV